jgi:hypothetical protein
MEKLTQHDNVTNADDIPDKILQLLIEADVKENLDTLRANWKSFFPDWNNAYEKLKNFYPSTPIPTDSSWQTYWVQWRNYASEFAVHSTYVASKFNEINTTITSINSKLDSFTTVLTSLSNQITSVQTCCTTTQNAVQDTSTGLPGLKTATDNIYTGVNTIPPAINASETRVKRSVSESELSIQNSLIQLKQSLDNKTIALQLIDVLNKTLFLHQRQTVILEKIEEKTVPDIISQMFDTLGISEKNWGRTFLIFAIFFIIFLIVYFFDLIFSFVKKFGQLFQVLGCCCYVPMAKSGKYMNKLFFVLMLIRLTGAQNFDWTMEDPLQNNAMEKSASFNPIVFNITQDTKVIDFVNILKSITPVAQPSVVTPSNGEHNFCNQSLNNGLDPFTNWLYSSGQGWASKLLDCVNPNETMFSKPIFHSIKPVQLPGTPSINYSNLTDLYSCISLFFPDAGFEYIVIRRSIIFYHYWSLLDDYRILPGAPSVLQYVFDDSQKYTLPIYYDTYFILNKTNQHITCSSNISLRNNDQLPYGYKIDPTYYNDNLEFTNQKYICDSVEIDNTNGIANFYSKLIAVSTNYLLPIVEDSYFGISRRFCKQNLHILPLHPKPKPNPYDKKHTGWAQFINWLIDCPGCNLFTTLLHLWLFILLIYWMWMTFLAIIHIITYPWFRPFKILCDYKCKHKTMSKSELSNNFLKENPDFPMSNIKIKSIFASLFTKYGYTRCILKYYWYPLFLFLSFIWIPVCVIRFIWELVERKRTILVICYLTFPFSNFTNYAYAQNSITCPNITWNDNVNLNQTYVVQQEQLIIDAEIANSILVSEVCTATECKQTRTYDTYLNIIKGGGVRIHGNQTITNFYVSDISDVCEFDIIRMSQRRKIKGSGCTGPCKVGTHQFSYSEIQSFTTDDHLCQGNHLDWSWVECSNWEYDNNLRKGLMDILGSSQQNFFSPFKFSVSADSCFWGPTPQTSFSWADVVNGGWGIIVMKPKNCRPKLTITYSQSNKPNACVQLDSIESVFQATFPTGDKAIFDIRPIDVNLDYYPTFMMDSVTTSKSVVNQFDLSKHITSLNDIIPMYSTQSFGVEYNPPDTKWSNIVDTDKSYIDYYNYLTNQFGSTGVNQLNTFEINYTPVSKLVNVYDEYAKICPGSQQWRDDQKIKTNFQIIVPSITMKRRMNKYGTMNIKFETVEIVKNNIITTPDFDLKVLNCTGFSNVFGSANFCFFTTTTGVREMYYEQEYLGQKFSGPNFLINLGTSQCLKLTVTYYEAKIRFIDLNNKHNVFTFENCKFENYRPDQKENGTIPDDFHGGDNCHWWCEFKKFFSDWDFFSSFWNFLLKSNIFWYILVIILIVIFAYLLQCYCSRRRVTTHMYSQLVDKKAI